MKIIDCKISKYPENMFDPLPEVKVTLEDGKVTRLFDFYPDEITFSPEEFIGLTVREAFNLKFKKDNSYLRR